MPKYDVIVSKGLNWCSFDLICGWDNSLKWWRQLSAAALLLQLLHHASAERTSAEKWSTDREKADLEISNPIPDVEL